MTTVLAIMLVMLLVGLLLGFVGAGGSGFMIAVLTVGFGYPIHLAMGTAIAAMLFTSLTGFIGQLKQKNTDVLSGILVGVTGACSSWLGSGVAFAIPAGAMKWCTSGMLIVSGLALWLRMSYAAKHPADRPAPSALRSRLSASGLGLLVGFLTGAFGIGSTPFIQLGLMLLVGLNMRTAAGTSMLVILPIAAAGAAGYYTAGGLDYKLLLTVLVGSMTGSYIGAQFTRSMPASVLKTGMIATPMIGACLLLL
ncbi:sulfite exporter TauE/SafE family protein [Paenibacillus ferrarius]|uniref:sulfite exporter TauE/SafE family protein n=1 Tax=Paenibacillus ferrarius TaxID=1469647 RepID=UPI003D2E869D